ncbi:MAG TPA: ABC transporter permease [Burkholderiales bacterium]|nr:ABC transporter permease [Burkholderiales bacterium]
MGSYPFSLARFMAVLRKEFVQMRRDRLTFAMMIGVPLLQLVLFGFAINSDPKSLPTAVQVEDASELSRSFISAMQNSTYFRIDHIVNDHTEGNRLLQEGEVQFFVTIPQNFSRDLARGEHPTLLVEADATDPAATSNAITALQNLNYSAFQHDLRGPLSRFATVPPPFEVRIHRRYNPEGITQYNIVPGLMGVVLTMTMVMMTALSVTRERERGTMENLLATPVRPLEVMSGKIVPYIVIGYVQVLIILVLAKWLFGVPMLGSLTLLSIALIVYIAANLAVGFTFSTIATNQLQAMQMAFFFFLPSILLSGFMFPFRGMPQWAQMVGEIFPLTHFLRIVRGILLKGNNAAEILPHVWPIALFFLVMAIVALSRYRETLD